jgi:hypothetical protein
MLIRMCMRRDPRCCGVVRVATLLNMYCVYIRSAQKLTHHCLFVEVTGSSDVGDRNYIQILLGNQLKKQLLESESYVTNDGQSASLSRNKAPIWGL